MTAQTAFSFPTAIDARAYCGRFDGRLPWFAPNGAISCGDCGESGRYLWGVNIQTVKTEHGDIDRPERVACFECLRSVARCSSYWDL
jgi:hypothetical protein